MNPNSIWTLHAYAIVCRNDYIADAKGEMPEALRCDSDWAYFQAQLTDAAALILGRHSHLANPNPNKRLRVVMSRQSAGLERKLDGWWWNPDQVAVAQMLQTVAPAGGKIAVPGGQGPFEYFLAHGLDAFHLSRAGRVALDEGQKLLGACSAERDVGEIFRAAGLHPDALVWLDAAEQVSLTVWRAKNAESN